MKLYPELCLKKENFEKLKEVTAKERSYFHGLYPKLAFKKESFSKSSIKEQ